MSNMEPRNYTAVQKHDILNAYLHHFSQTSMRNEVPGLLSFFFIQGQAILPYVRIPTGTHTLTLAYTCFGFNLHVQVNQSHGTSLATCAMRQMYPLSCSHQVQTQG